MYNICNVKYMFFLYLRTPLTYNKKKSGQKIIYWLSINHPGLIPGDVMVQQQPEEKRHQQGAI